MNFEELRREINKPFPPCSRDYRLVKEYYYNKNLAMLQGISQSLSFWTHLTKFDKIRKEVIDEIIKERDSREF